MKYLVAFSRRHLGKLSLIMVLLIGQVVGTLLIPYLIANMIDVGIMKGDMNVIAVVALQMLGVAVVTSGISVWGSYACADFGAAFGKEMREALFRKTQILSMHDMDNFGTSSLITRTTSDITTVQQTTIMVLQLIIPAPFIVIVAIIMTGMISIDLTIVLIISIVLFIIVALFIMKKVQNLSEQMQKRMDKINQIVRESILGIRVIRAFDNSKYEKQRSDTTFEGYANTIIALNRVFAILNPIIWLVMGLSMAFIIALGGYNVAHGNMNIGEITSISEYTIMTLSYLIMASFAAVTIPKMRACITRLSEVLDYEQGVKDVGNPTLLHDRVHELEFDDVTFSYAGAQEPVLHHLSFRCISGQTTAIIGGTGSGKSTMAGILQRLHNIDKGNILMNGVDIATLSQHDLREQIGYIPQKAFLFSGTIEDNLRMGKKDASKQDMERALYIAQAKEFVDSLPEGIAAPVSQAGKNFSGGQKQRLAIARALIKEASVLVFDDSFSALDFKTDATLRRTLKEEVQDTITIVIAQRVSTIKDADQIIVLDEGQIVGIGKHDALIKSCDVYREIANSQQALGR